MSTRTATASVAVAAAQTDVSGAAQTGVSGATQTGVSGAQLPGAVGGPSEEADAAYGADVEEDSASEASGDAGPNEPGEPRKARPVESTPYNASSRERRHSRRHVGLPGYLLRRNSFGTLNEAASFRITNTEGDSLGYEGLSDDSQTPTEKVQDVLRRRSLASELARAEVGASRTRSKSSPPPTEKRGVSSSGSPPKLATKTYTKEKVLRTTDSSPAQTKLARKNAGRRLRKSGGGNGGGQPPTSSDEEATPRTSAHDKGKRKECEDPPPPPLSPNEPEPSSSPSSDSESSSESDERRSRRKRKSKRRTNYPKVPEPAKYDATRDTPQLLKDWREGMIAYLFAQSIDPDSLLAVPYIQALTGGKAYEHIARNILPIVNKHNRVGKGHRPSPITFDEICEDFKRLFCNPDSARIAEHRWNQLKQLKNDGTCMTIRELLMAMDEIAPERSENTEIGTKIKFINALHPMLAARVNEVCDVINDDIGKMIAYATKYEQTMLQNQAHERAQATGRTISNYEALATGGRQRIRATPGGKDKPGNGNSGGGRRNERQDRPPRNNQDSRNPDHPPSNADWGAKAPQSASSGKPAPRFQSKPNDDWKQKGQQRLQQGNRPERRPEGASERKCFTCGSKDHIQRDCPQKRNNKAMGLNEEEGGFPPPMVAAMSLNGVDGFEAELDTGLSHSLMNPTIPSAMKLKIHQYETERKMNLGTKGSRAIIKAYCFADVQFANVKKTLKFDIANIAGDVIIGRNVMREHSLTIGFNPDEVLAKDPKGTPIKFPLKARKRTFQAMEVTNERNYTPYEGPIVPVPLPVIENDEVLRPNVKDESSLPKFVSNITDPEAEKNDAYEPSQEEYEEFDDWIRKTFKNVLVKKSDPLELAPRRVVAHPIKIRPDVELKQSNTVYKVADMKIPAYHELHDRHVEAGIWKASTSTYTSPMMALTKKDGVTLRPTVDLRARNAVVEQLVMPPMDQEEIVNAVASARFVTYADAHGAFQQIRTEDEDVKNSSFNTICGVYDSLVAQQGDRNSTISQHRLVWLIFEGLLGRSMRAYADDVWALSNTWRQHKLDVIRMLWRCAIYKFYLTDTSLHMCTEDRDSLGRKITYGRIGVADAKRASMLKFERPTTRTKLREFCGLVQYSEQFIKGLAEIMAPLTYLCGEVPFRWTKTCDLSFEAVKQEIDKDAQLTCIRDDDLAPRSSDPIHREVPPHPEEEVINPVPGQYLFLRTDASLTGGAAILGIGTNWWKARPVRFSSRKWNTAQMNYSTHDQEYQAVVDGVAKNESKLRGRKFYVIVDNKQVAQMLTSKTLNRRQHRLLDFLSEFDFKVLYIKGEENVGPDALSRQWEDGRDESSPDPTDAYLLDLDSEFREFGAMERIDESKVADGSEQSNISDPLDPPAASGSAPLAIPEPEAGFEGYTNLTERWADLTIGYQLLPDLSRDDLVDICRNHHSFGQEYLHGKLDAVTGERGQAAKYDEILDRLLNHKCSYRCVFKISDALAADVPEGNTHKMSSEAAKLKIGWNELFPNPRKRLPHSQPAVKPAAPPTSQADTPQLRQDATREEKRLYQVEMDRLAEAWDVPDEAAIDLDPHFDSEFKKALSGNLDKDSTFRKVIADFSAFPQYKINDGLLWQDDKEWGPRICVPPALVRGRNVREIILEHTHTLVGHGGIGKTLDSLSRTWWWPNITKDAADYVKSCPPCQATKVETASPRGKLHSMPIPSKPYEEIAIDFQGPFVMSEWNERPVNFLFNFLDTLSGEVIMVPCREDGLTAEKCADIFIRDVYPHWGVPSVIRSDRDVRFNTTFWKLVTQALGTTLAMSSSYHPETNGKIERMHRMANQIFRVLVSEEQTDWPDHVPFVRFAINSSVSKSTGFAPWDLTRTRMPTAIPSWASAPDKTPAGRFIEEAKTRQLRARDALLRSQVDQTFFANRHRRPDVSAAAADASAEGADGQPPRYWLSTKNLSSVPFRSRKWTPPFIGPFDCVHYNPATSTVTLDLPPRYQRRGITNVYHTSRCKLYVPNDEQRFPSRLTSIVPVFPLDCVEVGIAKALADQPIWVAKNPATPLDKRGATEQIWPVMLLNGRKQDMLLPHKDVTNETDWLKEAMARHNTKYPRNQIEHYLDYSKVPTPAELATAKTTLTAPRSPGSNIRTSSRKRNATPTVVSDSQLTPPKLTASSASRTHAQPRTDSSKARPSDSDRLVSQSSSLLSNSGNSLPIKRPSATSATRMSTLGLRTRPVAPRAAKTAAKPVGVAIKLAKAASATVMTAASPTRTRAAAAAATSNSKISNPRMPRPRTRTFGAMEQHPVLKSLPIPGRTWKPTTRPDWSSRTRSSVALSMTSTATRTSPQPNESSSTLNRSTKTTRSLPEALESVLARTATSCDPTAPSSGSGSTPRQQRPPTSRWTSMKRHQPPRVPYSDPQTTKYASLPRLDQRRAANPAHSEHFALRREPSSSPALPLPTQAQAFRAARISAHPLPRCLLHPTHRPSPCPATNYLPPPLPIAEPLSRRSPQAKRSRTKLSTAPADLTSNAWRSNNSSKLIINF